MRRLRVISILAFLICLTIAATVNAKPRSFHELVDAYFEDYFKANPSQATGVGFHQHDRQLEDFSVAAHQRNRRKLLEYLAAFQAINPRALSLLERDDREIMIATIHSILLEEDRVQRWRKNADNYSGAVTSSIFSLMKRNFAPPEERLRSVIEREKQIPRALQQARAVLRNPPKIYSDIAIDQLPGNIDFFAKDVPDAFRDVKDAALLAEFKNSNDASIAALKDYQSWLKQDLLPRSHGTFAIGAENYKLKLLYDEMVDVPLPRLLKIGYAQLRKDQHTFVETARRIDPNKAPEEVLKELEKDHPSATTLLSSAQQQLNGLRQFLIDKKIIANSFRTKIAHKKAGFAILSDPRYAHLFTPEEIEVFQRHIPWTRRVVRGRTPFQGAEQDLVSLIEQKRERLVLKPNDDYGGHGVFLGWETELEEWRRAISLALERPYVVQERAVIKKVSMPTFSDHVQMKEMFVDFNPFLFHNEPEGALIRLSSSSLMNITSGGGQTALLVLENM